MMTKSKETFMKRTFGIIIAALALLACTTFAQGTKPKLVLEKITFEKPAYASMLAGGDQLLLEKLVHAKKYIVMDREAAANYFNEKGIAGQSESAGLAAGDRTLYAHFIDCTETGKTKILPGNKTAHEYIVRLSLKICVMEETLEVETIENERIEAFCLSKVDLIDVVISRLARRAVFAVDFAKPQITDAEDGEVEIDYGKGFLFPGETYDVVTGAKGLKGRRPVAQIRITEVDKDVSIGTVIAGTVKQGYKLKLSEGATTGAVAQPMGAPAQITPVAAPTGPIQAQGTQVVETAAPVPGGRITCAVAHFDFAKDFKGAGYRKKNPFETFINLVGTSLDIMANTKGRHKDGRAITKIVLIAAPQAADTLFGEGVPVNFGFNPEMPTEQNEMLRAALGTSPRFDVRQYDLSRLSLDSALSHGITHVIEGTIRGTYIDASAGLTTIIFSLKLIDINDNNKVVSNQDRISIQVQGYSEPESYEDALREAVRQFATTF